MALSISEINSLAIELDKRIHGNHLANFTAYCNDVFYFQISKGKRLYLVLGNHDPRVYLSDNDIKCKSFTSNFVSFIKKDLSNAEIIKISSYNEDRILLFELTVLNAVFKLEKRYMVVELIPRKANLLILDKDMKILSVFRGGTAERGRLLIKGAHYEAPAKGPNLQKDCGINLFSFDEYCKLCMEKESSLEEKRKHERFKGLIHYLSSKQKSCKRKCERITKDIQNAIERSTHGELGDYIYTNFDEIEPQIGYFEYEGRKIPLDPLKSKAQNAESFYKAAKKARKTVEMGMTYLDEAIKELNFFDQLMDVINLANEEDLEEMAATYDLDLLRQKGRKGKSNLGQPAILPFQVEIEGTTYVFGRNSEQNNFLSFLYDHSKTHVWMHLKDGHGAHLIIRKENPSKKELELGAELTCLASKREEGEVIFTLKKNVYKGHKLGEAIVKECRTVVIKKISSTSRNAFAFAERVNLH